VVYWYLLFYRSHPYCFSTESPHCTYLTLVSNPDSRFQRRKAGVEESESNIKGLENVDKISVDKNGKVQGPHISHVQFWLQATTTSNLETNILTTTHTQSPICVPTTTPSLDRGSTLERLVEMFSEVLRMERKMGKENNGSEVVSAAGLEVQDEKESLVNNWKIHSLENIGRTEDDEEDGDVEAEEEARRGHERQDKTGKITS